jgi:hypothetical protein
MDHDIGHSDSTALERGMPSSPGSTGQLYASTHSIAAADAAYFVEPRSKMMIQDDGLLFVSMDCHLGQLGFELHRMPCNSRLAASSDQLWAIYSRSSNVQFLCCNRVVALDACPARACLCFILCLGVQTP